MQAFGWQPHHFPSLPSPPTTLPRQVCAFSPTLGAAAEGLYDRLLAEGLEVDTFMYLHLVTALGSGAPLLALCKRPSVDFCTALGFGFRPVWHLIPSRGAPCI